MGPEFQKTKFAIFKYVLVGVAFVGLVGWNINLQRKLGTESNPDGREKRSSGNSLQAQTPSQTGGAMFVRWGRRECPDDNSELVYSGIAGASIFTETGGSAEYTCLTREPIYDKYSDALEGRAKIGGVELLSVDSPGPFFDTSDASSGKLDNSDVVCAVCRSKVHSSQVMIPGRKECYQGWRKEYWGYLMTGYHGHKAQHSWACVDNTPQADQKGAKSDNGVSGLMYHVEGICGSLPCPDYVNGRELTCVVCTK